MLLEEILKEVLQTEGIGYQTNLDLHNERVL